ncbi:hypothetical protein PQD13_gp07 [Gordonia phage Clawz]|uniref:Uncharacterized protein n=1 Tax=Gordonia phage Clawz TaxID=2743910 RepID=A0AAE7F8T0_9CAUD|nr:hypothetical protein PQD13_gp07 [Gordonia phage Clawz]QKY79919.1 hypothetical protein SEA_CLAWZ_7 [Gordonia phage Clawz]
MTTMTVKFERIGRNHRAPDLEIDLAKATATIIDPDGTQTGEIDWANVADQIEKHARRWVMSSEVEIFIYEREDDSKHGNINVGGFRNAGTFEIEETK